MHNKWLEEDENVEYSKILKYKKFFLLQIGKRSIFDFASYCDSYVGVHSIRSVSLLVIYLGDDCEKATYNTNVLRLGAISAYGPEFHTLSKSL